MKQIYENTGLNKVLVDTSEITSMPPISDMFKLAEEFPRNLRFAIWISKKNSLHEDLQFGKTVALNRGVMICLFKTKDEALKWLQDL